MSRSLESGPEIVIATILRETGGTGVQSHVTTFREHLGSMPRPHTLVTPFSAGSPLLPVVFGARRAVRLVSRPAAVWWYRHWHGHYLGQALSERLAEVATAAVVYAQDPVSAATALRVRTTQPVVMTVHFNVSQADEWAEKGELPRPGRAYSAIRAFEADVLPRLDGLVYVSQFMRSLLEERLPALRRVPSVVIPNCVEIRPLSVVSPAGDLVTVGALEPRKNQGYLLDVLSAAARRGQRYTLTVIGDGPDRARLERQAAHLGLSGHVTFAGYQADPRRLVAAHRVYCHAAHFESFGIALVEAMAEGLPVLTASVGGIPEVVRPGVDADVWPLDDPEAGADRLVALLSDPVRIRTMGACARDRAETEFSSEVQTPRLVEFLSTVQRRH